jgi:hypothetical protein
LEGSKEGKSNFVCAGESVDATLLPAIKLAVVVLGLDVIIGSLVMEESIRSKAAKDLIQAQWDTVQKWQVPFIRSRLKGAVF